MIPDNVSTITVYCTDLNHLGVDEVGKRQFGRDEIRALQRGREEDRAVQDAIAGEVGALQVRAGKIGAGCNQKAPSKNQASVFRLFDLFQPEDLTGKVTLDNAGWKPMEWRAQDMAPWTPPAIGETNSPKPAAAPAPAMGFRALNDLGEIKTDQGRLTGEITGPAPVLHFAHSVGGVDEEPAFA